jgi:glutamine synthetase type III
MDYIRSEASVEVPITVENDLEVDESGSISIVTLIYAGEEDLASEIRIPMEEIIEESIDFYSDENGSRQLYTLAHELSRYAEMLRTAADHIEGQLDFSNLPIDDDGELDR